jgi:hypothetical protein
MVAVFGRRYSVHHVCVFGKEMLVTEHNLCDDYKGRTPTAELLEYSGGELRIPVWYFRRHGETTYLRVVPEVNLHFGV